MSSCIINFLIFIIIIAIIPLVLIEFNFRDPTEAFLPKYTLTLILIGFVIWYFSNEDDNYDDNVFYNYNNNYYNNNINPKRSYCYNQTDMNTYNRITKENTKRELEKLTQTKEFREMYLQKGENLENWNWQSRERNQSSCNCF